MFDNYLIVTFFILKVYKTELDLKHNSIEEIEVDLKKYSIELGGKWSPNNCEPQFHIAIIIPYRDRLEHLKLFLKNMHPFLVKRNTSYGIYLIEPLPHLPFNRGLLMNAGFIEALKDSNHLWNCFFFHDIDMLPEDERLIYTCDTEMPIHYAVAVSKFGYS